MPVSNRLGEYHFPIPYFLIPHTANRVFRGKPFT